MIGLTWGVGLLPRPKGGNEPGPEPFILAGAGGSTEDEPGPV